MPRFKFTDELIKEFVLTVLASILFAAVTWVVQFGATRTRSPFWVSASLITLAAFACLMCLGFGLRSRALRRARDRVKELEQANADTDKRIREIRDVNRRVAEQLVLGEQPSSIHCVTAYIVDPAGNDRIDEEWTLTFQPGKPGRVFLVEHWNTSPMRERVDWICTSLKEGTKAVVVHIIEEETRQKMAVYFHPLADSETRQISLKGTWPGLWRDLRESGKDYVETLGRRGMTERIFRIHVPLSLGNFEWRVDPHPKMRHSRTEDGSQQILELVITAPEVGETYRGDFRKS